MKVKYRQSLVNEIRSAFREASHLGKTIESIELTYDEFQMFRHELKSQSITYIDRGNYSFDFMGVCIRQEGV